MKPFDVYTLQDITPVRAKGSWLWDETNTPYLDLYGGHAVISIGHSHPVYVQKISEQLQQLAFYSNSVINPLQQELALKLGIQSGYTDYDLFLCNSGAEANENALKLASFRNGRKKVVAFSGSFHGRTSLAVAATNDAKLQAKINTAHDVVFVPLNDKEAFSAQMDETVCAVIIEGIQGVAGIYEPEPLFLQYIREQCNAFGAMCILDEVQSGYGRSGLFFAHQYVALRPDLITVAKGMGNGFPIAGVLIHPDFKAVYGMLGTTFGGNHLACAAAIAVLDVIAQENLMQRAETVGQQWIHTLKSMPGVKDVRGKGLMIGVEFEKPIQNLKQSLTFKHRMLTGTAANKQTIRLLPALTINQNDIDRFNEVLYAELQNY
ncbi:MAG: aminotransferase class III-fold pyridoxal phosphate-dependent enzyme [Sediminibacterium sp.]|nr:aminotransferase class III-fold pyridoxal phosphate-dependent enzyme [Sediminibacterium sp.]